MAGSFEMAWADWHEEQRNPDMDWDEYLVENMGDAREALDECVRLVLHLTGGDVPTINAALRSLNFPEIREGGAKCEPCATCKGKGHITWVPDSDSGLTVVPCPSCREGGAK